MANIKTSAAELIGKTPLLEVKKFEAKGESNIKTFTII